MFLKGKTLWIYLIAPVMMIAGTAWSCFNAGKTHTHAILHDHARNHYTFDEKHGRHYPIAQLEKESGNTAIPDRQTARKDTDTGWSLRHMHGSG